MMHVFNMLGASFTLIMLLVITLWIVYLIRRKACIIDVGWGIGFILAAWAYFFLGNGDFFKTLTLTIMVTIWAGRLTYHLYRRYRTSDRDDPRYQEILAKWDPDSSSLFFLMMFIFQGVLIVILSLPFFLVANGSNDQWTQAEGWGIALWLFGVIGESYADKQLTQFQQDPANKGQVLKRGLWRFSRHPNYFFEAIVWFGFGSFALTSDAGWLGLTAPLLMLMLLCKVSGIPLAEAQALRTKGDAYREYQRTTSVFVPWFSKR